MRFSTIVFSLKLRPSIINYKSSHCWCVLSPFCQCPISFTGFKCKECGYNCHEKCLSRVPQTCRHFRNLKEQNDNVPSTSNKSLQEVRFSNWQVVNDKSANDNLQQA